MKAILPIDLQSWIAAIIIGQNFVDPGRAIALFRRIIESQVMIDGHVRVSQFQMNRLIFFVVCVGYEDR